MMILFNKEYLLLNIESIKLFGTLINKGIDRINEYELKQVKYKDILISRFSLFKEKKRFSN
jgi:hypothetical protein